MPESADNISQAEANANELVAEREGFIKFGSFHQARSSKLGKRLFGWYVVSLVLFFVTVLAYCSHVFLFGLLAESFADALESLSGLCIKLTTNQTLILYYSSKFGLVAIFLIPLLWCLKRVSQMQALRSVHADKEALANTLEAMLYYKDFSKIACEAAVKEMFQSSYSLSRDKGRNSVSTAKMLREIVEELKALLPTKAE